ncbi:hypothetical protein MJH12_11070 [bacterium]|nr:hypothetical protein [bacterium]
MNKTVHEGVDGFCDSLIGLYKSYSINLSNLKTRSKQILINSERYQDYSEAKLEKEVKRLHDVFLSAKELSDNQIDDGLCLATELMDRSLKKRPYLVQILGALCMYKRYAIEMGTGEGKTLTAALSTTLFAWSNEPCHVVTTNDYLAQRDAESLKDFYQACDLSVGYINSEMDESQRRENYACNITYATSNNLLADFLKDQMQVDYDFDSTKEKIREISKEGSFKRRVLRGLGTAIIDEADSVLADDAITPLIISSKQKDQEFHQASTLAHQICNTLIEDEDYSLYEDIKLVQISDQGHDKIANFAVQFSLSWSPVYRCTYLIHQALMAKYFYLVDKQYVILDEKIVIVDEKTGRLMDQRSWSHGLHQAIEAKEGLVLSDPTITSEKMSFQSFFRLYKKITGMSGTFHKIEKELWRIYDLAVVRIPPRLKKKHIYCKDVICLDKKSQRQTLLEEIKFQREQGRAILVGTRTVKESQELEIELEAHDIETTVLNALYHKEEAQIIAKEKTGNI